MEISNFCLEKTCYWEGSLMILLCICLLENFACSGIQKNQLCVPKLFMSLLHILVTKNKQQQKTKPKKKQNKTRKTQAMMTE